MSAGGELLELVLRRRNVMQQLRTPAEKRELVATLDVSRSTIDRAIRDLELAGLIVWNEDGYRLTAVGRVLLDDASSLLEAASGADVVAEVLSTLPTDAPLDTALLCGASVVSDGTIHETLEGLTAGSTQLSLAIPDGGDPTWLIALRSAVWGGANADVVVADSVAAHIDRQSPGAAGVLAAAQTSATVGSTPPYGLFVADETVGLFTPDDDRVVVVSTDEAATWARERFAELQGAATPMNVDTPLSDADLVLEREGFVRLSSTYFDTHGPDPETCWRSGLGLAEVNAGYAIERRASQSDTDAEPLSSRLERRLRDGERLAVVGSGGSGKSTVCKQVACRWFDAGDPVLYREGGVGTPFDSPSALRAVLRRLDGTPLVVVEDAVRPDAAAVFELLDHDAAFLFDARVDEWNAAPERLVSAQAITAHESVETVEIPPVTVDTCRRLRDRVASTTGHPIETPVSSLLPDDEPPRLLAVLHRLALATDPLASDPPTTLKEDVRQAHERLERAGELALRAGVLVNLLNAAGEDVGVGHCYALDAKPGSIVTAVDGLEGVVLFDGDPVHEAWSERFLVELVAVEGAGRAHELVADCLSSWLSLVHDDDRRDRLRRESGSVTGLERIETAPREWVADTTRQVLAIGDERPGVAPVFGAPGGERVRWPAAAPPTLPAEYASRRGEMALDAGAYDDAERAFDAALARVADDESERARRLRANARKHLGTVANERGDYDTARREYRTALETYDSIGDDLGVAQCQNNLGTLSHITGDLDNARKAYESCIETYRARGVRDDRADTLNNLAVLLKTRGDLDAARERFDEALSLYRDVGTPRDEADVLVNLASIALAAGEFDAAERRSRESLDRYRELGADDGLAWTYSSLGEVLRYRGAFDEAETFLTKAIDACETVDDPLNRAEALVNLGAVARHTGNIDLARSHCREALEALGELGAREEEADALCQLGWLSLETDAFEAARRHRERAHEIYEDVGSQRGVAAACRLQAATARAAGDTTTATDAAERARSCARAAGDRYGEAAAIRELAYAADDADRLLEAATLFDDCAAVRDAIETYRDAAEHDASTERSRAAELAKEHEMTRLLGD